jgi:hypothetical protein
MQMKTSSPNKVTEANAGGPRQLAIRPRRAARRVSTGNRRGGFLDRRMKDKTLGYLRWNLRFRGFSGGH